MNVGAYFADAMVMLGALVLTIAVVGMVRLPDEFARIHAVAKALGFGLVAILLAAFGTGHGELVWRALVVAGFIMVTSSVGTHAIARLEREMRSRG